MCGAALLRAQQLVLSLQTMCCGLPGGGRPQLLNRPFIQADPDPTGPQCKQGCIASDDGRVNGQPLRWSPTQLINSLRQLTNRTAEIHSVCDTDISPRSLLTGDDAHGPWRQLCAELG